MLWQSTSASFVFKENLGKLDVYLDGRHLLHHSVDQPAIHVGAGVAKYNFHLGNFIVDENLQSRVPLTAFSLDESYDKEKESFSVKFSSEDESHKITLLFMSCDENADLCTSYSPVKQSQDINYIKVLYSTPGINRLWVRILAEEEERVYGGGEQLSHFSLRGRAFPMWCREQGVGRNQSTVVTMTTRHLGGGGAEGAYHTTYWPQSTILSDRMYFMHLYYNSYHVLNFTNPLYHEVEFWEDVSKATFFFSTSNNWENLLGKLTGFFGRQPRIPDWIHEGVMLGLQGGTDTVLGHYTSLVEKGMKVSSIWIQDWSGKFFTPLGKRVLWNWRWSEDMYPQLDVHIKRLKEESNVRFLAYINPHVLNGSDLYNEANQQGYLIKSRKTGKSMLVEHGEMPCGNIDLTNPKAYEWYKDVIKSMLRLGFSGWMADFGGEYLPIDDAVYHNGGAPDEIHNEYSEIWARMNREAVEEEGVVDDTFVFMRSGWGRSPGYTTMSWTGDQNNDFSYADGIAATIPAALSLGMSGMGYSHSDIGGYVSLFCMVRTQELMLRWAEMSVFTPVMRTHEGNRPTRNWQIYTSNGTIERMARLVDIHVSLKQYHQDVMDETMKKGIPMMRPLFLHYPDDTNTVDMQFQYMYGPDLLVAPVYLEDIFTWQVYLPSDDWVYLWNQTEMSLQKGETVTVQADMGNPPVFYRKQSKWKHLFENIAKQAVTTKIETEGLSWELLFDNPIIFFWLLLRKMFWYIYFNVQYY